MVEELIVSNAREVSNIADLIGETGLRHSKDLKYNGLKNLFEGAKSLTSLGANTKEILRSKLAQLPHPEQKLSKLEVISAISNRINEETI